MDLHRLCHQTSFILGGGVLSLISQALAERGVVASVFQPHSRNDLYLSDVIGGMEPLPAVADGLVRVRERSSSRAGDIVLALDEGERSLFSGVGSHVVLLGEGPDVVVLLEEAPDGELTDLFRSADSLVRLWRRHLSVDETERRLAGLAYMLYALKSVLPSLFEPFPVDFLATFLLDVMRECFCPEKLTLLKDEAGGLRRLGGDEGPLPLRQGLFSACHLSSVPVVVDEEHRSALGGGNFALLRDAYSAVLPLFSGNRRFFYLLKWSSPASSGLFHALELLGGIASRAMALNALQEERESQIGRLSEREFALRGLHGALLSLIDEEEEMSLLERILDAFGEMTQSRRTLLVLYDDISQTYRLRGERREGTVLFPDRRLLACASPLPAASLPLSSPAACAGSLASALEASELLFSPLGEEMERLFLLVDGERLLGYVAVGAAVTGRPYGEEESLETLASASAMALRRCRLLDEVRRQRDRLTDQVRTRTFLRELAGEIQQIRSLASLESALCQSLSVVLDVETLRLFGPSDLEAVPEEALGGGESVLIGSDHWFPLRAGGRLKGALCLRGRRSLDAEGLELLSLVATFVAPRLDGVEEREGGVVVDLEEPLRRLLTESVAEAEADGLDSSVVEGPAPLSEEQRRSCCRAFLFRDRAFVVLPFPWEGELEALFPVEEGWRPTGEGSRLFRR